jgi:hypothetical protein
MEYEWVLGNARLLNSLNAPKMDHSSHWLQKSQTATPLKTTSVSSRTLNSLFVISYQKRKKEENKKRWGPPPECQ